MLNKQVFVSPTLLPPLSPWESSGLPILQMCIDHLVCQAPETDGWFQAWLFCISPFGAGVEPRTWCILGSFIPLLLGGRNLSFV